MAKLNIKSGDTVVVIAGKDKGKTGTVKLVSPKDNRVLVEGVNVEFKHKKAKNAQEKSEIVKQEGTIDLSNVMLVCPSCNKATRVGRKVVDGKIVRFCKKCGQVIVDGKKATKLDAKKVDNKAKTADKVVKTNKKSEKVVEVKNAETVKPVEVEKTSKKVSNKPAKAVKAEKVVDAKVEDKPAKKVAKKASAKAETKEAPAKKATKKAPAKKAVKESK
jgi:large subunit ribosomal protein L24